MADNPNLFDELASPGLTMRLRAIDMVLKTFNTGKEIEFHQTDIRALEWHVSKVIKLAQQYEAYLKGETK